MGAYVLVPRRDPLCCFDDPPVTEEPRARAGAIELCEPACVVDDVHKRLLPAHVLGPDDAIVRIAALCDQVHRCPATTALL